MGERASGPQGASQELRQWPGASAGSAHSALGGAAVPTRPPQQQLSPQLWRLHGQGPGASSQGSLSSRLADRWLEPRTGPHSLSSVRLQRALWGLLSLGGPSHRRGPALRPHLTSTTCAKALPPNTAATGSGLHSAPNRGQQGPDTNQHLPHNPTRGPMKLKLRHRTSLPWQKRAAAPGVGPLQLGVGTQDRRPRPWPLKTHPRHRAGQAPVRDEGGTFKPGRKAGLFHKRNHYTKLSLRFNHIPRPQANP